LYVFEKLWLLHDAARVSTDERFLRGRACVRARVGFTSSEAFFSAQIARDHRTPGDLDTARSSSQQQQQQQGGLALLRRCSGGCSGALPWRCSGGAALGSLAASRRERPAPNSNPVHDRLLPPMAGVGAQGIQGAACSASGIRVTNG